MRRNTAYITFAALLVAFAPVGQVFAHGGATETASDLGWRIAVAVPLLLAGVAYLRRLRRAWRRAGAGRGIRRTEALAFGGGLAVLALMLTLPLHAWGRLRFAPHMAEHELLTVVAAPLLAAGRPGVPYMLALPSPWRGWVGRLIVNGTRPVWRALVRPSVAWALHGAALWLWHVPTLFDAALQSEVVHYLQHVTLLTTAFLFWASILPRRANARTRIVAVFSLFTTTMHSTLLGALLTLSPTVWYASYAAAAGPAGLSALEDQQLAGLIMWVPAGLGYLIAALVLCAAILRDEGSVARHGPRDIAMGGGRVAAGRAPSR